MPCCGKGSAKPVAGARRTVYTVTWGDGKRKEFPTLPAARVAMATERDAEKRRGMYVASKVVAST